MKKFLLTAAMFCAFILCGAEKVWFLQNFENREFFAPSAIKDGTDPSAGKHKDLVAESVKLITHNNSQAICLERVEAHHAMDFSGAVPMPQGRDFTMEADLFLPPGAGAFYMFVFNDKNEKITGINAYINRLIKVPDRQDVWGSSGIQISSGAYHLTLQGFANRSSCRIIMTDAKGEKLITKEFPMIRNSTPAYFRFGNCPPIGNKFIIDNLKVSYSESLPIDNRTDFAQDAGVKEVNLSAGNPVTEFVTLTGTDAKIELELKQLSEISSIRFGAGKGLDVQIHAKNSAGQNQELADSSNLIEVADGIWQADFKAGVFRTVTFYCRGKEGDSFGKIGLFSKKIINRISINDIFIKDVYGEFDLPVYNGKENAYLHLFNTTQQPIPVEIKVSTYPECREITRFRQNLVPGKNEILAPQLPDGYFVAEISDMRNPDAPVKGSFRRLMRRQTVPEPVKPQILKLSGNKMLFADGYYFDRYENIDFKTIQADVYKTTPDHIDPALLMQSGADLVVKDGKLMQFITCYDNYFRKSSQRHFITESALDDLKNWSIREVSGIKDFPSTRQPGIAQKVVREDWQPKPGKDGKITYRFYDPERDGKVNVSQINFLYVSHFGADTTIGTAVDDWGVMTPGRRTTWPIWYKAPGEALILTKTPIFSDDHSADEFESLTDSNDNFCGQWLSDDGKTVYYCRGHFVHRYPPYNVPYDNLSNGLRLLTVTRTSDGINFERCFISTPGKDEPLCGTQHYGAAQMRLRDANGMRIAIVSRYHAADQRIFLELSYSYDGFNWKRFPGQTPLLDNGPIGSWIAGYIGGGAHSIEYDNRIFYSLGWCCTAFHFMAELIWERNIADTSGAFMKTYMAPRSFEKWPLLDKFKGFDDIASYIRNTRINAGVLSWRKDGLFYAQAQNQSGWFITGKILAGKTMTANLRVKENGKAVFQLLDENEQPIPGYSKTLTGPVDKVDTVIFDDLPQNAFKVKCVIENTDLFGLGF